MITKLFEVRDEWTFIPVIAIKPLATNEAENYLLSSAGYGNSTEKQNTYVLLAKISGYDTVLHYDCYSWTNRTMAEAHKYLNKHFDELQSGAVIDVQFIIGETSKQKISQKYE